MSSAPSVLDDVSTTSSTVVIDPPAAPAPATSPISPAPVFKATQEQPVPPLTHTEASFDLTGQGKPHTPSIKSHDNQASITATAASIAETAANTAAVLQDKVVAGVTAAGHSASLLVNEAIEASRGMAGRLSGTSSRPSDMYEDELSTSSSSKTDSSSGNKSFQSHLVNGMETLSSSVSGAMSSSKQFVSSVDEKLGVSAGLHYVDEKLGVSAALHDLDTKTADTASHVYTALKRGNPMHAMTHAGAAAAIGQAELKKHEQGPLPTTTQHSEMQAHKDLKLNTSTMQQGQEQEQRQEEDSGETEVVMKGMQDSQEKEMDSETVKVSAVDGGAVTGAKDEGKVRRGGDRKAKKHKTNRSAAA